jgi:hypothetical protein
MYIRLIRLFFMAASIGAASLCAQPLALPFKPVGVQYSKPLDRLIMVSNNPNKVHIVNPVNGAETTINLNLAALSLSVSPDGTHAAVGHNGWISYVNLQAGYVEKSLAVSAAVGVLVLTDKGSIWVPPTLNIDVATGVQTTSGFSPYEVVQPAIHPGGNWVYYTRGGSPDDVVKGDISTGTFQYLYDSKYHGDFEICGGVFYSADGSRLLTGCGTLFRTTASVDDDITYNGSLSAALLVTSAVDSAVAQELVVIPGNIFRDTGPGDTEIQIYEDQMLNLLGRVALPRYISGNINAPWHGRSVYCSPDSTKLYVVLQADATANLANDYAIYTLTLSSATGCSPSLGIASTTVPASGGTVDVTVSATGGCLWQASSNATWLSVVAGGMTSGGGTVTVQAGPNLQTTARTGTVTIAGLTYTVKQNAASAPGTDPVSVSPVRPIAADYSSALDRMVLVSANPNLLTLLDPITGNSQTVSLAMPPTSLSVSTDGSHAAVGHDGLISYVNLATAAVEKTLPVTTNVYDLALGSREIYAFPVRDQWEAVHAVNISTGAETLWNYIWAGSTAGKVSPNGKYLCLNALKCYDISKPLTVVSDGTSNYHPRQWFSQDGARIFSSNGRAYRVPGIEFQDLPYSGTLEVSGLSAAADSSVQQVVASVGKGSDNDTTIKFFSQQYLVNVGSFSIPNITSGSNSYTAHGRYLFWNSAANRLFAITQADQTSGLLNDYAIYTVSFNSSCHAKLDHSTASVPAGGGSFTANVTADTGCAWKATSNVAWLTLTSNAFSAGPAQVEYIVDANPTTSARTATITIGGVTLTVTQAAGTQAQVSTVTGLLFRVADAEYSNALDRIVAISGSPSRLNIYDPATGVNVPVALPLPGLAVAVHPNGLRAAVCHDGVVSIINLQTAAIEKTVSVSIVCYDLVFASNNYVYLSDSDGWGTSSSVSIDTGAETKAALLYDGYNFRLNSAGDAIYTSSPGTTFAAVSRYGITDGPMKKDYSSVWLPTQSPGFKVWFTNDGRMVGDTGSVFRSGNTRPTDFIYTGTLSSYTGTAGSVVSLAHSTTSHMFASIGPGANSSDKDGSLFLHGDKYLSLSSKTTLPKISAGSVSASSHGKFLFWNSSGTKAYVILQADPSAGFLNDFAVYTLSPEFTPGCAVNLSIASGTAIANADAGSVAVTADSSCVWEAKSNVPWIQVDTGTLGIGSGNVGFSVLANTGYSSRSGTITIGTKTFTLTQAPLPAGVTAAVSATPSSGSGAEQVFQAVYSGALGYQQLLWVQFLIAAAPDGGGQAFCFLHYDVRGNAFWLYSDTLGFFVGPVTPGSASSALQGSHCALNTAGSSVSGSGSSLTVNLAVVFKAAATRNLYMRAMDTSNLDTGWVQRGTWTQAAAALPSMVVSPASGSGSTRTFVLTYGDPPGFAGSPLGWEQFLVAAATDGGGQPFCFVHYDRAGNGLWMYSSDVGFFLGPVAPGVASSALDSSACTVNPAGTTVQNVGGSLVLNVPLNLKAPMSGTKNTYLRSHDALNRDSGFQLKGTWTIP